MDPSNPYMLAQNPYGQMGSNYSTQPQGVFSGSQPGQGGTPLGQPDANGVTLGTLTAPNGGATLVQKQALAKALMGAVQNQNPNVGSVQPLGSLPPGILRG